jgi:hypothetical protein
MNDTDSVNPLMKLIVSDTHEIDQQKLADLLAPYAFIDADSKEVKFKDAFFRLKTNADRIEIIMLADKARALIFPDHKEGVTQTDVLSVQAMPEGSVKNTIKTLFDGRKIHKNKEGKYYIQGYRLPELFAKHKEGVINE